MFQKKYLIKTFLTWLPFSVALSCICLLVYAAVQYDLRSGANDPQIQLAEDGAVALAAGRGPASVLPGQRVEISLSLAPFIIIYDNQGHIFSSSASLHGKAPQVPGGIFTDARQYGERRFTWQPEAGVRVATVLVPYSGSTSGYVLAGRSLAEVESRIGDLGFEVIIVWIVSLLGTFAVVWIEVVFFEIGKKKEKDWSK